MLDLLTQFIRNSPVIAFVKDLEGRYRHVSEAWLLAFHTTEEAILGKSDHELFDAAQADDFVRNDREVLATGQPSRRFEEVRVPTEKRTFFSTKFLLVDAQGKRIGVGGFAIDVTDQQRVLYQLEQQKRFLERTQATARIGGFELDVATGTRVWTSETYRMFELEERVAAPAFEEILGTFSPDQQKAVRAAHADAIALGTPFHFDTEMRPPSGRRMKVRVDAVPEVVDGKVARISGSIQDVTAERLIEERLRHSSRMDAVGQLAGGVAHDFNNMLGAIVAAAELLQMEALPDSAQEALNTIFTASTQAAGLTRQLLLFSRKESSRRVPVDLHDVLSDALTILQRTLGRRIVLVVERKATRSKLLADGPQLSTAIMNLAINARDAMPDGGTLTFRTVDDGPARIRLEVADTGVGMEPELLSHIFDPFFTTKERGRGTGLGLATVDAAVRAHEGEITVRSQPGAGSVFELRFPLLTSEEVEVPGLAIAPKFAHASELLMIVDDELLVRQSLRQLLERLGYRVMDANSGADALSKLADAPEKPALMILDLLMPGPSAVETFHEARKLVPGLPVLFCSGYAPGPMLASIEKEPDTARLAKPFSSHALQTALRALLQK